MVISPSLFKSIQIRVPCTAVLEPHVTTIHLDNLWLQWVYDSTRGVDQRLLAWDMLLKPVELNYAARLPLEKSNDIMGDDGISWNIMKTYHVISWNIPNLSGQKTVNSSTGSLIQHWSIWNKLRKGDWDVWVSLSFHGVLSQTLQAPLDFNSSFLRTYAVSEKWIGTHWMVKPFIFTINQLKQVSMALCDFAIFSPSFQRKLPPVPGNCRGHWRDIPNAALLTKTSATKILSPHAPIMSIFMSIMGLSESRWESLKQISQQMLIER